MECHLTWSNDNHSSEGREQSAPSYRISQVISLRINQSLSEDIPTFMHSQNETAALVQQQTSRSLPPREIPVFEGSPLQFQDFIKAFEQGVEDKMGAADCLFSLEQQFTRRQPQQLVPSCQHLAPDCVYAVAAPETFWKLI